MASILTHPVAPARAVVGRTTLYALTIFSSSFLLFQMEPMIARMALPKVGGAPAVWNSAMLTYQLLLLTGYGYAHAIGRWSARRQAAIHLSVMALAACWLPIGLGAATPPADAQPALWVPALLLTSIGPLFVALSAQAPLLQRWFAGVAPGENPYSLYAASNLGSFGGLLAYPFLMEPLFELDQQRRYWTAMYIVICGMLIACAAAVRSQTSRARPVAASVRQPLATRVRWVALAALPSGLMLSTTTHLQTNIMALPMIWVLPLGLYLLSFSLAFAPSRRVDAIARLFPVALILCAGLAFASGTTAPFLRGGEELAMMFVIALALHRQLFHTRPDAEQLTGFYLLVSLGGALGGLFCGLLAPLLFDWTYEHPLIIAAAALLYRGAPLLPRLALPHGKAQARTLAGVVALLAIAALPVGPHHVPVASIIVFLLAVFALAAAGRPALFALGVSGLMLAKGGWAELATSWHGDQRARSYFGVSEVREENGSRLLAHGTTIHGMQRLDPAEQTWPLTYYAPRSGIGRVMGHVPALFGANARIGVAGLGAGTLACYARPGQDWHFFEIDPTVIAMATDPAKFTFLSRCTPRAPIILGDARINLAGWRGKPFDLLVLDAFSSDSPPLHLLTREAFEGFRRVLAPDGLMVLNISNRFMDFAPVVAALVRAQGWSAVMLDYQPDAESAKIGASRSVWIAIAPYGRPPTPLSASEGWRPLPDPEGLTAWSDEKASLLPALRLFH